MHLRLHTMADAAVADGICPREAEALRDAVRRNARQSDRIRAVRRASWRRHTTPSLPKGLI